MGIDSGFGQAFGQALQNAPNLINQYQAIAEKSRQHENWTKAIASENRKYANDKNHQAMADQVRGVNPNYMNTPQDFDDYIKKVSMANMASKSVNDLLADGTIDKKYADFLLSDAHLQPEKILNSMMQAKAGSFVMRQKIAQQEAINSGDTTGMNPVQKQEIIEEANRQNNIARTAENQQFTDENSRSDRNFINKTRKDDEDVSKLKTSMNDLSGEALSKFEESLIASNEVSPAVKEEMLTHINKLQGVETKASARAKIGDIIKISDHEATLALPLLTPEKKLELDKIAADSYQGGDVDKVTPKDRKNAYISNESFRKNAHTLKKQNKISFDVNKKLYKDLIKAGILDEAVEKRGILAAFDSKNTIAKPTIKGIEISSKVNKMAKDSKFLSDVIIRPRADGFDFKISELSDPDGVRSIPEMYGAKDGSAILFSDAIGNPISKEKLRSDMDSYFETDGRYESMQGIQEIKLDLNKSALDIIDQIAFMEGKGRLDTVSGIYSRATRGTDLNKKQLSEVSKVKSNLITLLNKSVNIKGDPLITDSFIRQAQSQVNLKKFGSELESKGDLIDTKIAIQKAVIRYNNALVNPNP